MIKVFQIFQNGLIYAIKIWEKNVSLFYLLINVIWKIGKFLKNKLRLRQNNMGLSILMLVRKQGRILNKL